jgi:hypothetical protein
VKPVRNGAAGQEQPGLLDAQNRIRSLTGVVADIAGDALLPESLARLRQIDTATLQLVSGNPRLGPCVGKVGKSSVPS